MRTFSTLALVMAAGCGSSGSAIGGSPEAGPAVAGPTVDFQVGRVIDQSTDVALDGVRLCVLGTTSCATTEAHGEATVPGVPAEGDFALEATYEGYLPAVFTLTTKSGAQRIDTVQMVKAPLASTLFAVLGVTADPDKGHVVVVMYDGSQPSLEGLAGATFALSPKSGVGPHYLDADGLPDTALTATSSAGYGVVANVDPGELEITLSVGNRTCLPLAPAQDWYAGDATHLRARVVPGHITSAIEVTCR